MTEQAAKLPPGMGVIWSKRHQVLVVYQLHVDGRVESARILAGAFLELDAAVQGEIAADVIAGTAKC